MIDLRLGDCQQVLRDIPTNSVDLILTDPPYYKVKGDYWDRQWDTAEGFLQWLDDIMGQWYSILKPNGSVYVFASPKMAARVETLTAKRFNVLNHIVWSKNDEPTHALKYGDDRFRQFIQKSERIIFAEHYGADSYAKGEAGYDAKVDELRGFVFETIRKYLDDERIKAGISKQTLKQAWFSYTGTKGEMPRHWIERIQFALPTAENYQWLRETLSTLNHGGEYLKRDYEDLKREYEDLRRPFSVSANVPYTDVWTFKTVSAYPGKHPCEKPLDMLEHIIKASSREGATVLDCFMGTGNTGKAAVKLGCNFIGIEKDDKYFKRAAERIEAAQAQMVMEL